MNTEYLRLFLCLGMLVLTAGSIAQERYKGTATVRVADDEYTIPIECNDPSDPNQGFYTEANRKTREETGRSSGVRLNVRSWKETTDLVVSLDRYVAWVPVPLFAGGEATLDMSPASSLKNNMPEALTYERWMSGERPEGLQGVKITADCTARDPNAPAFRKIPAAGN